MIVATSSEEAVQIFKTWLRVDAGVSGSFELTASVLPDPSGLSTGVLDWEVVERCEVDFAEDDAYPDVA